MSVGVFLAVTCAGMGVGLGVVALAIHLYYRLPLRCWIQRRAAETIARWESEGLL